MCFLLICIMRRREKKKFFSNLWILKFLVCLVFMPFILHPVCGTVCLLEIRVFNSVRCHKRQSHLISTIKDQFFYVQYWNDTVPSCLVHDEKIFQLFSKYFPQYSYLNFLNCRSTSVKLFRKPVNACINCELFSWISPHWSISNKVFLQITVEEQPRLPKSCSGF